MKSRSLTLTALFLTACASSPPPPAPAAGPAHAEASPAPAAAPAKQSPPLEYWAGRKDLIHAPAPPKPAELALPPIQRFSLKNGLEVVVVPRKELPVVSFGIAVQAGGYDEQHDQLGVSDFVAAMLRRGTKTRSADDISHAIDFVGGSLDAQATNESTNAGCSALSKDAKLCLDLLADILLHPSFPESEMGEVRDEMLAAIAARFDNPHELANVHFENMLFGEHHPDGWVLAADDVKKITRAHLETFWKTFYRPNRAILAVAGDVDAARIRPAIEKAFGSWARAATPARPEWPAPKVTASRILLVDRPDSTQATIVLGHQGIRHADPRWYAATLMNYVLGGSDFSSRLMIEVRAKRGLTYGIGSSFGSTLYEGSFRVAGSTKSESTWEALQASVNEIRRMAAEGPTATELDKAKGFYAGSYPFKLQAAAGVAQALVAAELHGLGAGYVRELPVRLAAVDEAGARAAAAALLHPDTMLIVIVGKAAAIEPQIADKGIPYEKIGFKEPISAAARAAAKTAKK
ncbi:MAG TPA: pitrilysin family protein [Polyangia bacterium]|nr:pitrilysin family protein [Polyangia bacterium]